MHFLSFVGNEGSDMFNFKFWWICAVKAHAGPCASDSTKASFGFTSLALEHHRLPFVTHGIGTAASSAPTTTGANKGIAANVETIDIVDIVNTVATVATVVAQSHHRSRIEYNNHSGCSNRGLDGHHSNRIDYATQSRQKRPAHSSLHPSPNLRFLPRTRWYSGQLTHHRLASMVLHRSPQTLPLLLRRILCLRRRHIHLSLNRSRNRRPLPARLLRAALTQPSPHHRHHSPLLPPAHQMLPTHNAH